MKSFGPSGVGLAFEVKIRWSKEVGAFCGSAYELAGGKFYGGSRQSSAEAALVGISRVDLGASKIVSADLVRKVKIWVFTWKSESRLL